MVVKEILRGCEVLARDGQNREALRLLDGVIAEAKREGRRNAVRMLSQHAAAIAEPLGDVEQVVRYRQEGVDAAPADAGSQFALADVLCRQGEFALAMQHAGRSYLLAASSNTDEGKTLAEAILKRWPQLKV